MSLSAKWTAVSLFGLTALAAGSMAFAGCTVTSGKVDDIEGGTVTPPVDGGGGGDSPTGATCTPNAQKGNFHSQACQDKLNVVCCSELKGCFNIVPDTMGDAAAPSGDCNVFTDCLTDCRKPLGDGAAPSNAEIADCQASLCDSNSPKSVQDAYDTLEACITTKANAECQ